MIKRKLIAFLLLFSLIFLYGCPTNPQPTPNTEESVQKVEFTLSKESNTISNPSSNIIIHNQSPSDKIEITIVPKDSNITPAKYDIRLISPREESIYFLDEKENKKITHIPTREFVNPGEKQFYFFRVLGEKIKGLDYDPYTLRIELHHNNKSIAKKELKVRVD